MFDAVEQQHQSEKRHNVVKFQLLQQQTYGIFLWPLRGWANEAGSSMGLAP